jgi:glycosyltransferase involved in cell wall biosynthesis
MRVTFLGQLGRRKGSADLLEALALLRDVPGWSAVLAGDGEIAETRQKVQALGLEARVSVPGWVSTEERAKLLDASDMLVLPSYAENLPMVILEAFAQGVPVISTPVGAIPEVIDEGRNGHIVKAGDVKGLSAAIARLIADPAAARRMGEEARADHAEKFEITRYLHRLSDLWCEAAAEATPRSEELNAHTS